MSTSAPEQWTLGALVDWTAKHLALKGVESPRIDAEVLLAKVVGCKRIDLYGTRFAEVASPDIRYRYREFIKKRLEGCPVAYLVGKKEFFGLEFEVSPAVLIPRPDTEHLVSETAELAKKRETPRILDLGAGSGCIPIALAKSLPTAQVTSIDISPEALAVARGNAGRFGFQDRIRFLEGDLFAPIPAGETFDFIVSNPPYIPSADIANLAPGVRDFEPHRALDGGSDGFTVFDRIIAEARKFLVPEGYLVLEIGAPQEKQARSKIGAFPEYHLEPTVFDYSGHPRVLKARFAGK